MCLRKRVNGKVNDGEVLINGSTMGVEFAGFGEARFFQFSSFVFDNIRKSMENRLIFRISALYKIKSFPKRGVVVIS